MGKTILASRTARIAAAFAAIAVAALVAGGVGWAARTPPTYVSQDFVAEIGAPEIACTLLENGSPANGALLGDIAAGEQFKLGKEYPEELSVRNDDSTDVYVRVAVRTYWTDESGAKLTGLSPDLIDLNFVTDGGWVIDEASTTAERTVLYYTHVLAAGQSAPAFTDTLKIDGKLPIKVTQERTDNVITTSYAYDATVFNVEADVDAVQTHNATDAILSAWGRTVTLSGFDIALS